MPGDFSYRGYEKVRGWAYDVNTKKKYLSNTIKIIKLFFIYKETNSIIYYSNLFSVLPLQELKNYWILYDCMSFDIKINL